MAFDVAYPCRGRSTSAHFLESVGVSILRMDKHFPEESNNRLNLGRKRASRRYCTWRRKAHAERAGSVRAKKGSSAGKVPPR